MPIQSSQLTALTTSLHKHLAQIEAAYFRIQLAIGVSDIHTLEADRVACLEIPSHDLQAVRRAVSGLVIDLTIARDNWADLHSRLGAVSEGDVLRRRLDTDHEEFYRSTLTPLLPRLALLDVRERLKLLKRCHDRVVASGAVDRLLAGMIPGQEAEWIESSALVDQCHTMVGDIRVVTDKVAEARYDLLPDELVSLWRDLLRPNSVLETTRRPRSYGSSIPLSQAKALLDAALRVQDEFGNLPGNAELDYFLSSFWGAGESHLERELRLVRQVLAAAYERSVGVVDHEAVFGVYSESTDVFDRVEQMLRADNAIWEVMSKDYFQPDLWRENEGALSPVLLVEPRRLEFEPRAYLLEAYRAFILGQWISVAALARAILEGVIKRNHKKLGIADLQWPADTRTRKRKDKNLDDLIDEASVRHPAMRSQMDTIRESGNAVLHRRIVGNWTDSERRLREADCREDALKVLNCLRQTLEAFLQ